MTMEKSQSIYYSPETILKYKKQYNILDPICFKKNM